MPDPDWPEPSDYFLLGGVLLFLMLWAILFAVKVVEYFGG